MATDTHYAEEITLFFTQGPRGGPRFFYFDSTNVFKNKEHFEILSIDLKNVIRNYMSPLQKLKFEKVGI